MNFTKSTDWINGTVYCCLVCGPRVIGMTVRVGLVWQAFDNNEYLGSYPTMRDAQQRVDANLDFHLLEPKNETSGIPFPTRRL